MTTLQEIFAKYKPKEEFSIYVFKSKYTDKFVACIFKKMPVNRFAKEYCGGTIKNIAELDIKKFLNDLRPYIEKRNDLPTDSAKYPLTPDEAYQKV